jgi:hypothetical protein
MSLGNFEILQIFKAKMIEFMDVISDIFPDDKDLIAKRILFENHVPIEESMNQFSIRVVPLEGDDEKTRTEKASRLTMIRERNDNFIKSNDSLFFGVNAQRLANWKQMWESRKLTKEDRAMIWDWLDLFVRLAQMYVDNLRKLKAQVA